MKTKTTATSRNGDRAEILDAANEQMEKAAAKGTSKAAKAVAKEFTISPPRMETVKFAVVGTSPLVINRFGSKARAIMMKTQEAGSQAKKGVKREPKDFRACYEDAKHTAVEGWNGIHATGFRRGLVDACKLVGFHMTKAKLGLFVVADGYDSEGTPLVKITKGTPTMNNSPVRNASGVADIRARPLWGVGWEAVVTLKYDADMFSVTDVANLLLRMGCQVGIGEGRANSRDSVGTGWGFFDLKPGQQPGHDGDD